MKNLKKKILLFAMAIMMTICLAACSEDIKVIINFETNGGSEIAPIELTEDQIGSFTLPENPTKEGYNFVGWYLDSELETLFEQIDIVEGTITLYAKWQPEATVSELTKEKLVGSWAGVGIGAIFNLDDTCSFTVGEITYAGKYAINDEGLFKVVYDGPSILNIEITGYVDENEKLNVTAGVLLFVLTKLPSFDFNLLENDVNFEQFNGISFESKFRTDFLLNINMIDREATEAAQAIDPEAETVYTDLPIEVKLDYKINGVLEKVYVNSINDVKAYFKLTGEFSALSGEEVTGDEYETFKEAFSDITIYIANGYAYIYINLPTSHEEEITDGEIPTTVTVYDNTPSYIKINLSTALELLASDVFGDDEDPTVSIPEAFEGLFTEGMTIEEIIDAINYAYNSSLTTIYAMGVTEENINSINNLINALLPDVVTQDTTITISYNKDKLLKLVDKFYEFVRENKSLVMIINTFVTGEIMTENEWNELLQELGGLHEELANGFDMDKLDLILVKDANTGDFNEINGIIDVCIYLSETKKSYISFKYESTFMVTSRDASIEWPDFRDRKSVV